MGQAVSVPGASAIFRDALRCSGRAVRLLVGRHLHVPNTRVGSEAVFPDGRAFVVFRESTCDVATAGRPVTLLVWFHLRAIPPGARFRRWLFERLCILNTLRFAGFPGYLVKCWMVNPRPADYAGSGAGRMPTPRRVGA